MTLLKFNVSPRHQEQSERYQSARDQLGAELKEARARVRTLEEQLGASQVDGARSMAALKDVMFRIKPLVSPPVPTTDAGTETLQVHIQ